MAKEALAEVLERFAKIPQRRTTAESMGCRVHRSPGATWVQAPSRGVALEAQKKLGLPAFDSSELRAIGNAAKELDLQARQSMLADFADLKAVFADATVLSVRAR